MYVVLIILIFSNFIYNNGSLSRNVDLNSLRYPSHLSFIFGTCSRVSKLTSHSDRLLTCSVGHFKDYIDAFYEGFEKLNDKAIVDEVTKTSGWKYLVQCLESILEDGDVDISEIDKYKSFKLVLNKRQIFNQITKLVNKYRNGHEGFELFGVPIAIKDNMTLENTVITNGNEIISDVSTFTATVVDLLMNSGAVVIGKTNLDEFGIGSETLETLNPNLFGGATGGSSGGSSNAVAGGVVIGALGTDTGGSSRLPAAYCGCVGYRPSFGLISRYGFTELCANFDTVGIEASNVRNTITILKNMILADFKDMYNSCNNDVMSKLNHILINTESSAEGVRIGMFDRDELLNKGYVDQSVYEDLSYVESVLNEKFGIIPERVDVISFESVANTYHSFVSTQIVTNLQRFKDKKYTKELNTRLEDILRPKTLHRYNMGKDIIAKSNYKKMLKDEKRRLIEWVDRNSLFSELNFLVLPISSIKTPHKEYKSASLAEGELYTTIASLLGLCSITLPLKKRNITAGIQVVGAYMNDDKLLQFATIIEKEL